MELSVRAEQAGMTVREYVQAAVDRWGTQAKAAEALVISQGYVSRILRGERGPKKKRLTAAERRAVVEAAARGVPTGVLAKRHGVTRRTINYTIEKAGLRRHVSLVPA